MRIANIILSLILSVSSFPILNIGGDTTNINLISQTLGDRSFYCSEINPSFINLIKNDFNKEIIKSISSFLPEADIISKKVLEFNSHLIENLLDDRYFIEAYKKPIILSLIHIVQMGDNAGTGFLESYYNLVDCLLP